MLLLMQAMSTESKIRIDIMIDQILLFPYWVTLKTRHFLYNKGFRKVHKPEVPSICIGNITVGGTGKTPHTEMIIRTLLENEKCYGKNIAVLSRGYKRTSKGFQQVVTEGTTAEYGDEPLQIKRKFPIVTVAVDKKRVEGCNFLVHPDIVQTSSKAKRCKNKDFPAADLIIFDDAFQHRAIKAGLSIVLVDSNRPIHKDHLLPIGSLRDLPQRISEADTVIVTKCPKFLEDWEKKQWAKDLGIQNFDIPASKGTRRNGKEQHLFFTHISYDSPKPVFPEYGDGRYVYAQSLILFSGIANDKPLADFLSGTYKIVKHLNFPDHHSFSKSDINSIAKAAQAYPTSVVMTTEKDCQRVQDSTTVPEQLKKKLFYMPIKVEFLDENEKKIFSKTLDSLLK